MVEQDSEGSDVRVQVDPKRLFASIVANQLNGQGDRIIKSERVRTDRVLILLGSLATYSVPNESQRNRLGRQLFQSYQAAHEALPPQVQVSMGEVAQAWFEVYFPGRWPRWQRESSGITAST